MPFHALLDNYLAVFLAAIVGFVLVATALIAARVLAPFSKETGKRTSYECGMLPIGRTRAQFSFRYYLFAILFLIFDVEAVFLFPWAVTLARRGQDRLLGDGASSSASWAPASATPGRRECCNGTSRPAETRRDHRPLPEKQRRRRARRRAAARADRRRARGRAADAGAVRAGHGALPADPAGHHPGAGGRGARASRASRRSGR